MKSYRLIPKLLLLMAAIAINNPVKAENLKKPIVLDTIYANDHKNVALFFPEPIKQAIAGNSNFIFTYNREQEQHFGLLKAKPGEDSNLLVLSKSGLIFSYILKYSDKITKLNYFIAKNQSIGLEKPEIAREKITIDQKEKENEINGIETLSKKLSHQNQGFRTITKRSSKIKFSIENIVYQNDIFYFVMKIKNKSNLDYDINYLNFLIETRKKSKRKSTQQLYQEPLLKYQLPKKIKANSSQKLVYALSKFSLSKDRRLIVKLNENSGERNLELKLSHRRINNPNPLLLQ